MFLKTDRTKKDGKPTPPGSWSITGRLTVLYAASAFGMLVLAIGLSYWVLVRNLEKTNIHFLADKVQILRAILWQHVGQPNNLPEEVGLERAFYVRILANPRLTLIETPRMSDVLPVWVFPEPVGIRELPKAGIKLELPDGHSYLLVSAWSGFGYSYKNLCLLQVALNITSESAWVAGYRQRLAFVLLGGILLSAGAGIAITRRGLLPIQEITRTAERITATQLHERIDPEQWPKELTVLAGAFNRMLDRLGDSFSRLSQFSADLAHELRTPINNLVGEADLALSRTRSLEEYRQVLESNLEEYGRLARMIDGLLFLARAENPKGMIQHTPLDARKEIEAVVEFHDAIAKEQEIEVACHGDATLSADAILFRRAVSNLLSNALRYTSPGGKVVVSVKPFADRSVQVDVADNGMGIPPEHLPKIFDRLYRVDRARSSSPHGTGLGLAIVKSIMTLHGGAVTLKSEPSRGTTVTLHFPGPDSALPPSS